MEEEYSVFYTNIYIYIYLKDKKKSQLPFSLAAVILLNFISSYNYADLINVVMKARCLEFYLLRNRLSENVCFLLRLKIIFQTDSN